MLELPLGVGVLPDEPAPPDVPLPLLLPVAPLPLDMPLLPEAPPLPPDAPLLPPEAPPLADPLPLAESEPPAPPEPMPDAPDCSVADRRSQPLTARLSTAAAKTILDVLSSAFISTLSLELNWCHQLYGLSRIAMSDPVLKIRCSKFGHSQDPEERTFHANKRNAAIGPRNTAKSYEASTCILFFQ